LRHQLVDVFEGDLLLAIGVGDFLVVLPLAQQERFALCFWRHLHDAFDVACFHGEDQVSLLQQFAGQWETESEAIIEPGKPPMKCTGIETASVVGGFWILSEIKSTVMDQPMHGVMTLGYDPQKKKFIGTWVDSSNSHLWKYEGTLDATGKILTLESEGPSFTQPGKLAKYKDVTEFKTENHKILTSSVQGDDGKWISFMTANGRRKKVTASK